MGKLHAAQIGSGPCDLLLRAVGRKKVHRRLFKVEDVPVILGHLGCGKVFPGAQNVPEPGQQGRFADAVSSRNADPFTARNVESDVLGQHPLPDAKPLTGEVQYGLAVREANRLVEFGKDRGFLLREVEEVFLFPFKAFFHGKGRMHLLFQQARPARIAPGNHRLLMIDPVVDLSPLLHLFVELIALILRDLCLMIEQIPAKRKVVPVRTAGDGDAALGLPDKLLHVNDDVGRPLNQRLVMGDIEDRQLAPGDEVLEPAKRRNIQIIRRLVEQQDVRLLHQQTGQLHLDPLAAGQCGKKLLRQEKVQRQAELCQNVHVQIVVRISEVGQ